ncbi:MAG: glycosyltransferase family 4 protein [Gemmatimonadota bacterium]|nr:glycosyltransferase family 4 protein [Gemmatimonadota bacterium]
MKILLVNWLDLENPQAGGAEIHLFEIFSRLVLGGDRVHLVCSGWKGAQSTAEIQGITVERIGDRNTFAVKARGAIRRALKREEYDIVVEDVNKIPLFTPNLTELPCYTIVPHLFGPTAFREASLPVALVVWLSERPLSFGYRRAAFHAISHSTKEDLVRRGVAADRVRVIFPGLDVASFSPVGEEGRNPDPTFLYLGRLRKYKGVETAIRGLLGVRKKFPRAILQIAGEGPDRQRLQGIAHELGVSANVEFLGLVSENKKREVLSRAWAVVFPSVKEGWGMTNVEAAASGTPAIAADSPGLRETVLDDETGFLVPCDDVDAWSRAMLKIAENPQLRDSLGVNGRKFAEELSWDRAAAETRSHLVEWLNAETGSMRKEW